MEALSLRTLLAVWGLATLSACGVGILSEQKAPPRALTANLLKGVGFDFEAQEDVDLTSLSDRPLIIMFADDTCQPCGKEADEVRGVLDAGDTGVKPENLLTLMTGTYDEDALIWKQTHRVEWRVLIDRDRSVFKSYCERDETPCTVIQRPREGIVYSHVGITHLRDLIPIAFGQNRE